MAPPENVQSGAILPEPVLPSSPDVSPLDQRERYHLMLRFYLTPAQIDRTPVDVSRTLLATLH
jgi:hypothetical protein